MDYAATTPLDKRVKLEMNKYLGEEFANAGSVHKEGVAAKKVLEESRTKVARILQCRSEEIIFTSGGTESNNLAILGVAEATAERRRLNAKKSGRQKGDCSFRNMHFITTVIEHSSVLECFRSLEKRGAEVDYVKVDENGLINPREIEKLLRPNTVLVSVGLANGEIGVIQSIAKISKIIKNFRQSNFFFSTIYNLQSTIFRFPVLHTDSSQAAQYLNVSPDRLGADLITLDGHKMCGPKGVGALFVKRNTPIASIMFGGKQEKGLRPGTENVAFVAGFAKAFEIANAEMKSESARLAKLRDYAIGEIAKKIVDAKLNGDKELRLPNNINISIAGIDAEFAVIQLDEKGIACSTKSVCLGTGGDSYVVGALGQGASRAQSRASTSLRFTLGRATTKKDVDYLIKSLLEIIDSQTNNPTIK